MIRAPRSTQPSILLA